MNIEVVIGIVQKEGNVLIVKRKNKEGELLWQFPGGKVEQNETVEEAVVREIKEETNLKVSIDTLIGQRIHPYTKKTMAYFGLNYISEEVLIAEAELDEYMWVKPDELEKYFTTNIYAPIMKYLSNNSFKNHKVLRK